MKISKVLYNNEEYLATIDNNINLYMPNDFLLSKIIKTVSNNQIQILPWTPSKIVAMGLNYKMHIEEMADQTPKTPLIFMKPNTAVIGNGDRIVIPKMSQQVDYEAELAVVISQKCKNVNEQDAKNYILGYTCANDVTARDLQRIESQWTRAKSFDTFCPLGPYIVTDIDANNLKIQAIKNGEVVQNDNTSNMLFNVNQIISFISQIMTLNAGDVILTGTPEGIGQLHPKDSITINIENIGSLTNIVE